MLDIILMCAIAVAFSAVFVVHGASYEVFSSDSFNRKLSKYCGQTVSLAAFAIAVWFLFPIDKMLGVPGAILINSKVLAGIYAAVVFRAGHGLYARLHFGTKTDPDRTQSLDFIVNPLIRIFSIPQGGVNHGRMGLFVKGFLMGGIYAPLYLLGWEIRRILVQRFNVSEPWANFVQEAGNGFMFGLIVNLIR